MAKTLSARGSDGRVAIHEPGANLDNPLSNLHNIHFHSDLDYLRVGQVWNGTLSIPAGAGPGRLESQFVHITNHGLGYKPMVLGSFGAGGAIPGTRVIQTGSLGGTSSGVPGYRSISLCADTASVYVHVVSYDHFVTYAAWATWVTILVLANPSI